MRASTCEFDDGRGPCPHPALYLVMAGGFYRSDAGRWCGLHARRLVIERFDPSAIMGSECPRNADTFGGRPTCKEVDMAESISYRHTLLEPCPIEGGEPVTEAFTDHSRPGVYNACIQCHDDTRSVSQRLADLERERGSS